ncbi:hypothetical protein M9435_001712 [Picochlorum sp. BPE23]|nr:hypothetical protein M9435_001712 [Picochlorum sp. BPE23]
MVEFVEVKTLCGGQRFELSQGGGYPLSTVRDVRRKLSDIDARFQGCKIMYNGEVLKNDRELCELGLAEGCFLVACLRKRTKAKDKVLPEEVAEHVEPPLPIRESQEMDTMLPGYRLRPNPSPVKDSKRRRHMVTGPCQDDEGTALNDGNDPRCTVGNDALAVLHIPKVFEELERVFDVVWGIIEFLMARKIRCQWKTVKGMLRDDEERALVSSHIDILARLCPCVIAIYRSAGCSGACRMALCEECGEHATLEFSDAWKARSEKVPEQFKVDLATRISKGMKCSKKRVRQSWILRKSLINFILECRGKNSPWRYSISGLEYSGAPPMQKGETDFQSCIVPMSLEEVVEKSAVVKNDTVRALSVGGQRHSAAPPLLLKKTPPCTSNEKLSPDHLLEHLKSLEYYKNQIVHEEILPRREAQTLALEQDVALSDEMKQYLRNIKGIDSLYSHQVEAIQHILGGQSCVVSTSTASGKSMCYLVPLFEFLLKDSSACGLLIFPTKALAQDQLRNIQEFASHIVGEVFAKSKVCIYDGDTELSDREEIRANAQVLLTNPDMLHCSILPYHRGFANFLANLRLISIDEAHSYRGVFGSHVALTIRRLKRICARMYQSSPTCILTTATVANPQTHASNLTGEDSLALVSVDGSPREEKTFVLYNPPIISERNGVKIQKEEDRRMALRNARQERQFPSLLGKSPEQDLQWETSVAVGQPEFKVKSKIAQEAMAAISATVNKSSTQSATRGADWRAKVGRMQDKLQSRRASPIVEISYLLSECVKHGLRTIAFCKTRKLSELVATYTREIVAASAPSDLLSTISVYRAGYSPAERRDIERRIFDGSLLGIAATNALELGIDIGGLDVTLHLGFQGTVASLWQQAGRAGRRNKKSLSVYVGWDGPLDQFFMSKPEELFGRTIEAAQIDIANPQVLKAHITCAAYEMPLNAASDAPVFGNGFVDSVRLLIQSSALAPHASDPGSLVYAGRHSSPSKAITLRDIDQEKYTVIDESSDGRVLEEIEKRKAFFVVYEGAIYMFQSGTFIVKSVDRKAKIAIVHPTDVKYYTTTIDYTDVHLIGDKKCYTPCARQNSASVGYATVTTHWMGFARIWRGSGKVFDTVDLFLPDVVYETVAVSQRLPPSARQIVQLAGYGFRDSVHAAAHALMNVLPLYLMCNPEDIGTECDNLYDTRYKPERLLLFDRYPGGIGLCEKAQPIFRDLIEKGLNLIVRCSCESDSGCPGCIQSTVCSEYNSVLSKGGAQKILQAALQMNW